MSGSRQSFRAVHKDEVEVTSSENDRSGRSTKDDRFDDKKRCGGCYWPLFIFIFLFIIIIIICFACGASSWGDKCGWGNGIFAGVFLFFIIWVLILWFFCRSEDSTAAWFFLLLIFAIIFVWFIAKFLSCLC